MSVILFDVEELARVGRALVQRCGLGVTQASDLLAVISRANANCYAYRYGEEATGSDAEALAQRIRLRRDVVLGEACATAGLLHYNCCEDRDYLEEEDGGLKALVRVLVSLLRASQVQS